MALPPFFDRVYGAIGGHLEISRESLQSALENVTVGICCNSPEQENDTWIAELTTNLAARLYPRLAITGADTVVRKLRELALSINPDLELSPIAPGVTTICASDHNHDGSIYASASGWVAHVTHASRIRSTLLNPYAAGTAAALACGELFRRIFLRTSTERDISVSLLDFGPKAGTERHLHGANMGEVLFVGVGAIGNSAIWTLARHKKLAGHLLLVDPEELSLLNLQRYVLGTYKDVGRQKVATAERALHGTTIRTSKYKLSLEAFAERHKGIKVPTLCISIDNEDGRRAAQALLPKLIINGWTGEQGLGASWHELTRDAACLACLYHPRGKGLSATEQASKALGISPDRAALLWVTRQGLSDDDLRTAASALGVDVGKLSNWRGKSLGELYTDVVCGAAPIDVAGLGRVEVVPLAHQSVLAGILTATELLKRTDPALSSLAQDETLVSWDDVLRPPPTSWVRPRAREATCFCNDPEFQQVYRNKWA